MKKPIHLLAAVFMTALSLGAQAYAQNNDSWDYYWKKNQGDSSLTSYSKPDWKNEGSSSYFGLEGAYGFNSNHSGIDMVGGYLTYSAYDTFGPERTHQFLFDVGYLKGNRTHWQSDVYAKETESQIPLIVGYNYNLAVHDRILLYAGFRGGIVFGKDKIATNSTRVTSSDTAALFGGGCGVKFIVTPRMDVLVGYEFQRNFTRYFGENDYQNYHFIKVGVNFGF